MWMKFDAHNNCTNAAVACHITDALATTVMPSVKQCAVHRQLIKILAWDFIWIFPVCSTQKDKCGDLFCFALFLSRKRVFCLFICLFVVFVMFVIYFCISFCFCFCFNWHWQWIILFYVKMYMRVRACESGTLCSSQSEF